MGLHTVADLGAQRATACGRVMNRFRRGECVRPPRTRRAMTSLRLVAIALIVGSTGCATQRPCRADDGVWTQPEFEPPVEGTVIVLGEVRRPGVVSYRGALNLSQALEAAGGITEFGWTLFVVRTRRDGSKVRVSVPIRDVRRCAGHLRLWDGDVVHVRASD